MSDFNKHLGILKWFVIIFFCLIAFIVVPVKIQEHNYTELLLVFLIGSFIFTILFVLVKYFSSMAICFKIDEKQLLLIYERGKQIAIEHSNVDKIKITPYRYIFFLKNGDKKFLSRIIGLFDLETDISPELNEMYSGKFIKS